MPTEMTYEEALAEGRRVGAGRAADPALMALFCEANIQRAIGAVSPQLMWEGAQKQGLTTRQLLALCEKDPMGAAELMWV